MKMNFCGFLNEFCDKNKKEVVIKGSVIAEIADCGDNSVTVDLPKQNFDVESIIGFATLDYDHKYFWYNDAKVSVGKNTIKFDGFDYFITGKTHVRYKFYAVFEEDGMLYLRRLYSKSVKEKYSETYNRDLLYYDVIFEGEYEDTDCCACVNITRGGYYALFVFNKEQIYNYKFTNVVTDLNIVDDKFSFDVKVNKVKDATQWALVGMDKADEEPVYYDIPEQPFDDMGDYVVCHCNLSRDFVKLDKPATLHLYVRYKVDGKDYYTCVKPVNPALSKKIRLISYDEFTRMNDKLKSFTIRALDNGIQFVTVAPTVGYKLVNDSLEETILQDNFTISRILYGTHSVSENGEYKVHLNADMSSVDRIQSYCYYPKTKEKVIVDVVSWDKNTGDLVINVSKLEKSCEDFTARSYMVCVAFLYEGLLYPAKLKNPAFHGKSTDPEIKKLENRVFPVLERFDVNGVEVSLAPMYFASGIMYIRVRETLLSQKDLVSVKYKSLNFHDSIMDVVVKIPRSDQHKFTGFAFTYRYKKSEDRLAYFVEGTIKKNVLGTYLSASIDMSKFDLKRVIWDLYAVFEEDGRRYGASITITDRQVHKVLYDKNRVEKQVDCTIKTEEGEDIIFPYHTSIHTVAFLMREKTPHDSSEFRAREFEALKIYKKNKKELASQNIILIYEKFCTCAQDNGYCFFKHCMEHDAEKLLNAKIYYIIDKNCSDYERVKKYDDHVIDFLSLDHMVYLLAAKLLVSSDSKPHSYVWRPNNSFIADNLKNKELFFLQHGVTALKRVDHVFGKKSVSPVNKFVATSSEERSIIINNFGYKSSEVCMTGFARWDDLIDKSKDYNEILIMPTWRSWLDEAEDSTFLQSDYYKNYSELLHSERLNKLLEEYDLVFNFYIHPKFKDYISNFNVTSDRMRLIPYGEEPLNELMMRCKLLITDYSSVCWDVYYMNKPVLFYQFDYDLYNTIHGSYLDMEKDLFGYRSLTLDKLLDDFENACKNNFKQPREYEIMRDSKFAFTDRNNSARIVREIKKMKIFD